MYIFTTLGNAHKNVWEQSSENSPALFSSKYEKNSINKIQEEIKLNRKILAIGYYAPYYGRNSSQQGEPAQYDHSSLLLINKIEYISNSRYDIRILFTLLNKISPDDTKKIYDLKQNPIPLIKFIDDKTFLKYINLNLDRFM